MGSGWLAKASMLHHIKDNIMPLFEDKETAKGLMEALEAKYGPKSETHVQLLLDKFNSTRMNEGDYIGDCINKMKLLAKELANADNFVSDKMLVTTILNNLPPSWDHIVTIFTHSGKKVTMISLPVLLVFEERMKIKITNWWWLKQFLNQELLNDNGKIHHFHILKKKKSKKVAK